MQAQGDRPGSGNQKVPGNRGRRHRQENGPQRNQNVKGEHSLSFCMMCVKKISLSACACLIIERSFFFDVVYTSLLCCATVTQPGPSFSRNLRKIHKGYSFGR